MCIRDSVNPTHYALQIANVLKKWKSPVPIVYNSSGYEEVETLKELDGLPQDFGKSVTVSHQFITKPDVLVNNPSFSHIREIMAVSYTHLDVYKRQGFGCAHGGLPGGWRQTLIFAAQSSSPLFRTGRQRKPVPPCCRTGEHPADTPLDVLLSGSMERCV